MQAAEDRVSHDRSHVLLWLLRWTGNALVDALLRPGVIEVGLILLQCLAEMTFVQDEEEVEAFAPYTAQESLANGIGHGRLIGCFQDVDIGPISDSVECVAELAVVVTNKKPWSPAKWGGFPQLLGYPNIVRTSGHLETHQATKTQLDHNKDKDGPGRRSYVCRKSTAQMSLAWLRRNVAHVCLVETDGRACLMYF